MINYRFFLPILLNYDKIINKKIINEIYTQQSNSTHLQPYNNAFTYAYVLDYPIN